MTEKPVAAEALSCGLSLGRTVARIQMPPVTPPVALPVAPPVTPPIAGAQSLRKLTGKVRHGKKLRLPARTRQCAKIAWNAAPKKVCTVKGVVLKTKKKGTCRVKGAAPAVIGFGPWSGAYRIHVK